METVCVLMSTYNGEKYLQEQLDSIINQVGVNVRILVRDDGSTDSTKDILNNYKREGYLDWYSGTNLKSARSFMDLVNRAPESEYYAFSDQDDYWLPTKLQVAVNVLKSADSRKSALYYSRTTLVDENLLPIKQNTKKLNVLGMPSAFIINNASGCTMVFNSYLLKRVQEYNPQIIGMHDSWFYKICVVTGNQIFADNHAYILYRQHDSNVLGGVHDPVKVWKRRFHNLQNRSCFRSKVANEVLVGYKKFLSEDEAKTLEILSKYRNNYLFWFKALLSPKYSTNDFIYNMMFKAAILLRIF